MAKGVEFTCHDCFHEWTSRKSGGAPSNCPACHKDNFSRKDVVDNVEIMKLEARERAELAEKEKHESERKRIEQEEKIKNKEEIIKRIGKKEYFFLEGKILNAKIENSDKEKLREIIGRVTKSDLITKINQLELNNTRKTKIKYILIASTIFAILLFLIVPFSIGVFKANEDTPASKIIPDNNTCQYKSEVETNKIINVLYDNLGNRYDNPLSTYNFAAGNSVNIGGPCKCTTSFSIKNNIDKRISFVIYYQYSNGGAIHDGSKNMDLEGMASETIKEEPMDACWASCSFNENSINFKFNSNEETTAKTERAKEKICTRCGLDNCLNDGSVCAQNTECGSGICNILSTCGKERIVSCPSGKINKNDTCVDSLLTKFKCNYFTVSVAIFIILLAYSVYIIFCRRYDSKTITI